MDSDAATQETPSPLSGDKPGEHPVDKPGKPVDWPQIADYWPDQAEIEAPDRQPAPAHRQALDRLQAPPSGPSPNWIPRARSSDRFRLRPTGGLLLLAILLVAAGVAFGVHRLTTRTTAAEPGATVPPAPTAVEVVPTTNPAVGPASLLPSPTASPSLSVSPSVSASPSAARRSSASVPARPPALDSNVAPTGTFEFTGRVSDLAIGTGRPGNSLAKVSTPPDISISTRLNVVGSVVRLSANGLFLGGGTQKVSVVLDERVSWTIQINGGVQNADLDLSGGRVRSIDLNAGSGQIDLALPRFNDDLTVRMLSGVSTWRITTDGRVGVRADVGGGANRVVLYGRNLGVVGRGKTVTSDGPSRLDLDAPAGIGSLSVSAR